jgi:cobalt-zinc-cadmium efflux system membrane fusion protein
MNILSVSILALLLCSCGKEISAEKQPKEAASRSGEVILDEAAQSQAAISVEAARLRPLTETIVATGHLVVNDDKTWHVGSIVDGKVMEVFVNAGDSAQKGQVLARIHSHDVHEARAAYQRAAAELARMQSVENYAQRARDRARRLLALKAISQEQVEMAETELRGAQSGVAKSKSEMEKEKLHLVEFMEVPIEDEDHEKGGGVEHEADLVPVRAPAAGLVLQRKVTPGSVVKTGEELFIVTNPVTLWMIASVNESGLGHLRAGQRVRISVRAYPDRSFAGRILKLGEELDSATRTLKVRVAVPNADGRLKPEMFATAEIERGLTREALFVPESAAQEVNGQRVVFVRKSVRAFEPRPIQVARTEAGQMEVTEGLRPGDQVVIRGGFLLKSQLLKKSLEQE